MIQAQYTKQLGQPSNNDKNCWSRFKDFICCVSTPKFPETYQFQFSGLGKTQANQSLFQTNYVRTSKYTILSFFPKALLLQFKRLANIYFLMIAILQTIPTISPLSPATAWAPLIVVLAISLLRQGYEDYQRIVSDHQTNYNIFTRVIRNQKLEEVNWSKIVVGDIVKIQNQETFPADLILLSSSLNGQAFIQTASLDGEKNLKNRNSFKQLIPFNTVQKINKLKGRYQGGNPDKQLHKFSASMTIEGVNQDQPIAIVGDKQLLYRGTRLKNTQWIYGLVFSTGRNTKIIMNSNSDAQKMSQIEIKVNYILGGILALQILISIGVAVGYSVFRRLNEKYYTYIQWPSANDYSLAGDSTLVFFAQFVLINTMIPISLIVSIEMVKFFQMIFIQKDNLLFSEFRGRGVSVKSASLNEELGQIQYVFSDKTGTLTLNLMQFKIAVIETQMFGDLSIIQTDQRKRSLYKKKTEQGLQDEKLNKLLELGEGDRQLNPQLRSLTIRDSNHTIQLKLGTLKKTAQQYFKALSLAHEVMVEQKTKKYQGPSPDEVALVKGAQQMEYQFIKSTQSDMTVKILGKETQFELLQIFSFTSDRKRMSVVVRENGLIKMYMKGADSIVQKRLASDNRLKLTSELERFSLVGLRTLLIAMKLISEEEYKTFKTERHKLVSLPANEKQEAQNQLINNLEKNMYIIGATAVQDRLQDEVPETIRDLLRANIKVWMLTGDKMQTAENIAKSCNLIQRDFQVMKYAPPPKIREDQIIQILSDLVKRSQKLMQISKHKALLIQGSDLTPILKSERASKQLAQLAKNCEAVVCCRLLPSQKAEVVRLVRKHLNKITLAIGDGANDVPMIKQAHIGIGLFGEEGMGAVQASDYALPQFRMLWRILFVHGRWNYIRISQMILYFFYKNMLFTLPQFYIAFYCGFSAQTIFDDWYVALYNLAFTSIPLIIRAVFEQDVNYIMKVNPQKVDIQQAPTIKTLVKQQDHLPKKYKTNKYIYRLFPKIYFIGQQNCVFNMANYLAWIAEAAVQSVIIFFFNLYILGQQSLNSTGINPDFWIVSLTIYSTVILVVTFKLASHTKFWSKILFIAIIITTLGFYILHMWLTNFTITDYVYGTTKVAWSSLQCYFIVLLCVCLILFVDGIVVYLDFNRGGYTSKMRRIIQESKMFDKQYYQLESVTITDNITTAGQKVDARSNNHRIKLSD